VVQIRAVRPNRVRGFSSAMLAPVTVEPEYVFELERTDRRIDWSIDVGAGVARPRRVPPRRHREPRHPRERRTIVAHQIEAVGEGDRRDRQVVGADRRAVRPLVGAERGVGVDAGVVERQRRERLAEGVDQGGGALRLGSEASAVRQLGLDDRAQEEPGGTVFGEACDHVGAAAQDVDADVGVQQQHLQRAPLVRGRVVDGRPGVGPRAGHAVEPTLGPRAPRSRVTISASSLETLVPRSRARARSSAATSSDTYRCSCGTARPPRATYST
jgi:hypothetical protein